MNKKLLFAFVFAFLLFGVGFVSAHHYSSWDRLNDVVEDRVVHNKMYDYWKYGSYWQHRGDWPVYRDLSYSNKYHYSRGNKFTYNNHWHHNDYEGTRITVYGGYDRPYGREHASDRKYVVSCGYVDGFYRDCY